MFDPTIIAEHWFWWLTTMTFLVWYSTVTIYVAIRGATDIKQMFQRLQALADEQQPPKA